jgi:hypothetical protein
MALSLLILASVLTLGWFLYSRYQSDHWHQRHRKHRHSHHQQDAHAANHFKDHALCETLEDVKEQVRHSESIPQGEHPFHCVAVAPGNQDCDARQAIDGKRFLSADAPPLPLPGCQQAHCQCHYEHYEDRRVPGSDRRARYGLTEELYGHFGETNKRLMPKGRRRSDM